MVLMSRSVRRTFCRCSSAGMVVRVVTVLLISLLATVVEGRARRIDIRGLGLVQKIMG